MKYILVDCFDTIFHRKESNECTLYDWAREMSDFIGNKVSSFDFYKVRKKAEKNLRSIMEKEPTYKDVIKKVYDKLEIEDIGFEDFLEVCYDRDFIVEKNQLCLDEKNIEEIKKYKKNGDKIILVSDFYMPKKFFLDIFDYFGLSNLFDNFFISSEIGLRKSTGSLYKFIINYYNIDPCEFIMIGDDEMSDMNMAAKHNIKTIHVPYNNKTIAYEDNRRLKKYIHQSLDVKKGGELFKGFDYAIILFCDRLYKNARLSGCKRLLFCSREGQVLKQIFDRYQDKFCIQNKIITVYFCVSRRATLLPSLKEISEENFDRIFRQYRELTLNDFLFSIGFSFEEIASITSEENHFARIYKPSESQLLRDFLFSENFKKMYEIKRRYQKKALSSYVKEVNGNLDSLFIVDIGWKGTIQDNLYEALDGKTKIQGFYFGLYGYKSSDRNSKKGLMFDLDNPKKMNALFAYQHLLLESVFVANHGAVLFYKCDGNQVKVFLSHEDKLELFKTVKPYQNSMMLGIDKVISAIKNSPYSVNDFETLFSKEYLFFLCTKLPRHRTVFETIKGVSVENFGNISGIKEKIPQVNGDIHRKQSRKFMYVYASYNMLNKLHLKIFYPIAWLYCIVVYWIKKFEIFKVFN